MTYPAHEITFEPYVAECLRITGEAERKRLLTQERLGGITSRNVKQAQDHRWLRRV